MHPTAVRCLLCREEFASSAVRDRHACRGLIGEPHDIRRQFWTPTVLYVVFGAILLLSFPLMGHAADVHPVFPLWIMAGHCALLGVMLQATRSEEPVADWLVALNPFTRDLCDPRARRRNAVACFGFAAAFALAAAAMHAGVLS